MTTSSHPDRPTDDNLPFPPRYWWLKRVLAVAGLLLVALIALRWWWGWEAERRFEAKIAEYRALGQPVTLEDFQFPPIPDEENAAYFLMQAVEKIKMTLEARSHLRDICNELDHIKTYEDNILIILNDNKEVFELIEKATAYTLADWKLNMVSPVLDVHHDPSPIHELGSLLSTATLYNHLTGNDATALEYVKQQLFMSNIYVGRQAMMARYIGSIAASNLSVSCIEEIAPELRINTTPIRTTAAMIDQIRTLIEILLDDGRLRMSWQSSMYGDRLIYYDFYRNLASDPGAFLGSPGLVDWEMRFTMPLYRLDVLHVMEFYSRKALAGLEQNFVDGGRYMPEYPEFCGGLERAAHVISSFAINPTLYRLKRHFQTIAMRRMAAVALALRLYEIEHGRRPETLDALVPGHLPSIPADPFASDNSAIRYLPESRPSLLYSVGNDGVDDNGRFLVTNKGDVDMNALDLVFFLDGRRPREIPESLTAQPQYWPDQDDNLLSNVDNAVTEPSE